MMVMNKDDDSEKDDDNDNEKEDSDDNEKDDADCHLLGESCHVHRLDLPQRRQLFQSLPDFASVILSVDHHVFLLIFAITMVMIMLIIMSLAPQKLLLVQVTRNQT